MITTRRLLGAALMLVLAIPAAAQRPPAAAQRKPTAAPGIPRGFIALDAGVQTGSSVTDQFVFTANAEAGSIEARYPSNAALLLGAGAGYRFWGRVGVAAAFSRSQRAGAVSVRAEVPHPILMDQDRVVEGEAPDLSRSENAAHLQLFYEMPPRGQWRARVFAGPSYVTVEQELVREVTVNESYPFDSATFRSALTGTADGSAVGFNLGADLTWMLGRRAGAGVLLRYVHAGIDLDAPESRTVSIDGGGLQAGVGLRFAF